MHGDSAEGRRPPCNISKHRVAVRSKPCNYCVKPCARKLHTIDTVTKRNAVTNSLDTGLASGNVIAQVRVVSHLVLCCECAQYMKTALERCTALQSQCPVPSRRLLLMDGLISKLRLSLDRHCLLMNTSVLLSKLIKLHRHDNITAVPVKRMLIREDRHPK